MKWIRLALLLAVALVPMSTAAAAPDEPAPASAPLPVETTARAKAAEEMATLARFCAGFSAFDDARKAFGAAVAFGGRTEKLDAEVEKLKGKESAAQKGALAQVVEKRTKALAKCADLLAPAVAAYAKADRGDDLARLVALMRAEALPIDAPLGKLDVVFFEPYLDWRTKKDAEKLAAGWEHEGGEWLDPVKVAAKNAGHASWADPWVLDDGVHEVRTTLPLRTARHLLAHAGAFRRFVLDYFAGEWDLKPPEAKLPIVLTATRAEMDQKADEAGVTKGLMPPQTAAYYARGAEAGRPCLVSLELQGAGATQLKVELDGLWPQIERELARQIAAEYSKHAVAGGYVRAQFWTVEGLAQYLPYFDLVNGEWVLRHPTTISIADGFVEGAFAWCKKHLNHVPPLAKFVGLSAEEFNSIPNYHVSATLTWFLLEGKDRAYRAQFVKLLETVHQCRADDQSFAACFPGVDLKALDAEFRAFCRAIQVEKE